MEKNKKYNRNPKVKKNTKRGIKNMGLDIDKNEYMEIILSNSNHPESAYRREKYYD